MAQGILVLSLSTDMAFANGLREKLLQRSWSVQIQNEPDGSSSWFEALESKAQTVACAVVIWSADARDSQALRRCVDYLKLVVPVFGVTRGGTLLPSGVHAAGSFEFGTEAAAAGGDEIDAGPAPSGHSDDNPEDGRVATPAGAGKSPGLAEIEANRTAGDQSSSNTDLEAAVREIESRMELDVVPVPNAAIPDGPGTIRRLVVAVVAVLALGLGALGYIVLDEAAWRSASERDDVAAYRAYLDDWAFGAFRGEAMRRYVALAVAGIPQLEQLNEEATVSTERKFSWEGFSEEDWSRQPALVLMRIVVAKDGFPALSQAAQRGDPRAAVLVGAALDVGAFFLEPSKEAAHRLFEAACAGGFARGCASLGYSLPRADTSTEAKERAKRILDEYCAKGIDIACGNLASAISDLTVAVPSTNPAEVLLRQKCEAGSAWLCAQLGFYVSQRNGGKEQDRIDALKLYQLGCDRSIAWACNQLGEAYYYGTGTEKNLSQARRLYELACPAGSTEACFSAAWMYRKGLGGDADMARGLGYNIEACSYGKADSCNSAGYSYELEEGTAKDLDLAYKYYRQGCTLESGTACSNLGHILRDGTGRDKDPALAYTFYEKGCGLDYARACAFQGRMIALKEVEPAPPPAEALALLRRGCEGKDQFGCFFLGEALRDGITGAADPAGAITAFEAALAINPDYDAAKRALAALRTEMEASNEGAAEGGPDGIDTEDGEQ